jgi:hypothetical protein
MDWAAWGPTIVSIISAIFFAGVIYSRLITHGQVLKNHAEALKDVDIKLEDHGIKISRLEAFREGYAAGKMTYEKR